MKTSVIVTFAGTGSRSRDATARASHDREPRLGEQARDRPHAVAVKVAYLLGQLLPWNKVR